VSELDFLQSMAGSEMGEAIPLDKVKNKINISLT
jgi:hypothetical protein